MTTKTTTNDYWISPDALFIERNALALPDYVQASCVGNAQILVYVKGIIDYDAGHNYRRWRLQASPTVFNTHTEKYVYAAIPRTESVGNAANIVFPSEEIDIYGRNAEEQQVGSEDYYYIFLQGILSSSGDNGTEKRVWRQGIVSGYLSSDEAINAGPAETDWYRYDVFDQTLTFLRDLTMKAGTVFRDLFVSTLKIVSGGRITFEGQQGEITGIGDADTPLDDATKIVTPKLMDNNALSKRHDDETPFNLAMHDLKVNGAADIFGNTVIHGDALVEGGLTVGTPEKRQPTTLLGDLTVGTFNKGVEGANVDFYGNAEFEGIVARSFLEVPELRFNRTTIMVGNKWQTQGGGIIQQVWTGADEALSALGFTSLEGVAQLKLETGEVGAVAVNDKCQGVFHFTNRRNDLSTADPHDGNFHFAGFTTIYFRVKEIYTPGTLPAPIKEQTAAAGTPAINQFFRYELRAATCADLPAEDRNRWTDESHPQQAMHFACYANETDSTRQCSGLTTTTYQLYLAGMTDWTYTQENMQLIIGWLNGFTMLQRVWDKEKKEFVEALKELEGEGIATGNIYMWGMVDQFDRVPSIVTQQLYFLSTPAVEILPDGIRVAEDHLSYVKGEWQTEPLTPSPSNRVVWQQWLYTYSDGTYSVSNVAFHAADPTALTVVLNKNIISVAISDWYDTAAPDDISFDITAQVFSGTQPLDVRSGKATYGTGDATTPVELTYTAVVAADGKSLTYHVTLKGFVGVEVDGATPEDAFMTFMLTTDYGTATTTAAIAQNREGEDGQNGEKGDTGAPGAPGPRGYTGVTVRRGEWEAGVLYRNDSGDTTAPDGNRYLDEVSVTDLKSGTPKWYLARPSHNGILSEAANEPLGTGNDFWEPINDLRPLRTSFADIMMAFIQFLQVNQIQITDDNGTPYGAFGGGTDMEYPLWFGGATPADAVMRVNRQGDLWSGNKFSVINGKMRTDGNDSHVEVHDGVVEMFGSLAFPNIKVGVDADGCAVLEFYSKDGQKMYNLGPNGLDKITTTAAYFSLSRLKNIGVDSVYDVWLAVAYIQKSDTLPYYQFFPKQTKTDTAVVYWYGGTSSNTPPEQRGLYYQSDQLAQDLPTGELIPDGWYAAVNNGSHPTDTTVITPDMGTTPDYVAYFERLYHFTSGRQDKTGKLTWKQKDGSAPYDFQLQI